jgi:hypothetical protein
MHIFHFLMSKLLLYFISFIIIIIIIIMMMIIIIIIIIIIICFNRFFPRAHYCYLFALEELKLHNLHMRRYRLDALFLTQVYVGFKFCPSVLEIVGLRVPARYIRDFALFNVCSSCKNCPSATCASAANIICRDVDIFGAGNVHLNFL